MDTQIANRARNQIRAGITKIEPWKVPESRSLMPTGQTRVIQYLRHSVMLQDGAGMTDGQLLERFVRDRDDMAFAALVRRHGPMVWRVCRGVLCGHHDAEDAFQTTFLVLVRRAASVWPREMVGNWLYGVARQTALKARMLAARRKARELQGLETLELFPAPASDRREWQPLLHQELSRLPDKYRVAIVLCDLESKTCKEAARQLGLPEGTVSGRLTRARAMLAKRIARHGPLLPAGALVTLLVPETAPASVPSGLIGLTIRAGGLLAAGNGSGGVVSASVARLIRRVSMTMLMKQTRIAMSFLLALAVVLGGMALSPVGQSAAARPSRSAAFGVLAETEPEAKRPAWRESYALKHEHPITVLSCSAEWTAAGDEGGNLFVWDSATGKNRKLLAKGGKEKGLTSSVDRLQFTPDGAELFAVLGGRTALCRFNLKTGRAPGLASRDPIWVGVSADGEIWLQCYGGGTLLLRPNAWTQDGALKYETIEYKSDIQHVIMSPDSKSLAALTADGELHIHETDSRREVRTVAVGQKARKITAIQFSPDGKRIAVVGDDAMGNVYDAVNGQEVATLKGHRGIIFSLAFSPDGKTLLTGGDDNTARLWNAATGKLLTILEGHTDSVRSVAFHPSGQTLFTGSADKTVKAWSMPH
jgi:RNA polymerase sigma factor (sigma-70 family)